MHVFEGSEGALEGTGLVISPARLEEFELVLGVLEDAARWVTARGLGVWRPGSFSRERITEQIGLGEVFLARLGSRVTGTITLQWSDRPFWGEQPPDSGYVHKIAVKREFSGRGIGVEMLKWAGEQSLRAGKKYLRLNCLASNAALRRYYEGLGFEYRGEIEEPRGRAALYEKKLKVWAGPCRCILAP